MISTDTQVFQEAQQILQEMIASVPSALVNRERQAYIATELIPKASDETRLKLRSLAEHFLHNMRLMEASDIDIGGPGNEGRVWLRINGEKQPVDTSKMLSTTETDILIQNIISREQRRELLEKRSLDFSYSIATSEHISARYRATIYFEMDSLSLNMRAINTSVRTLESYGFHAGALNAFSLSHSREGLVLITGITGSGKSTTLDAIVDYNNRKVNAHVVVISSPIEFIHRSKKCIIKHREVGSDTLSFKTGTIESLRQDPDIIVIGEMRDPQTILAALEVADSGHKVLSTLHTSSAVESIDRIIGEVPPIEQKRVKLRLADLLRCVISQKLVPSVEGKLVLAKEVLLMTPSVRAAIKNGNTPEIYQMLSEGGRYGMITMEQDLRRLSEEGVITLETALSYSNNKRRMQQLLHGKILRLTT